MRNRDTICNKRERMDESVILVSLKPVSYFTQRSFQFFGKTGAEFSLTITYNPNVLSPTLEALKKFDDGITENHTKGQEKIMHTFRLPRANLETVKNILIEGNPSDREKISQQFEDFMGKTRESELEIHL